MSGSGRRFLIDASMAQGGGGFTYAVNMLPSLVRLSPQDHFRFLVRNPRVSESMPSEPNLEVVRLDHAGPVSRLKFVLIDAPRIASAWGADLYFSVAEMVPPRLRCPAIASFRNPNVVDLKRHAWPPRQRTRLTALNAIARFASRRCERILFVSEDSARWMGDILRIPAQKRSVIHHGIDLERWGPREPEEVHPRPYILSVSSIYRYKNYVRLIEAYVELCKRIADPPDLLIVGDNQDAPYARAMEEARIGAGSAAARIHILGEVPYADVRRYYAGADLFVFPSYLETFGHPLLEAMASGIPLVAADTPIFREIAGDAALYASPFDVMAMAAAIEQGLGSVALRRELRTRGLERAAVFPWSKSAERHLALFDEVVGS